MYKNQLQELAQRSCFSLPSYTCVREGPDHAPRFKAAVNFNGETFESPAFFPTLRQAEHAAAEVALNSLSSCGPSLSSLAARILDDTGVYKNLLQEISQRVGVPLPRYTTYRSGLGHFPVFTGKVELAGIAFTGEPAKNKKQAEKNAAMSAWSTLKKLAQQDASSSGEAEKNDEQEQNKVARALLSYRMKTNLGSSIQLENPTVFLQRFTTPTPRPPSPQRSPSTAAATSKILPFFSPRTGPQTRPVFAPSNNESNLSRVRDCHRDGMATAPPAMMRSTVPAFSAPPPFRVAPPVRVRQVVPVFAAPAPAKLDVSALPKGSASQTKEMDKKGEKQ